MSNLNITGDLAISNVKVEDFVISTKRGSLSYHYGSSTGTGSYYYREYNSGFIEMWLSIPTTVKNNINSAVITFPIAFRNVPYVTITELKNHNKTNDTANNGNSVKELTTTSLTIATYSWDNGRYIYVGG